MNKEASPIAMAVSHNCPSCQRVLYNRRLKKCGFCGAPIPEEFRFTQERSAALEKKIADIEEQRLERQRAAEEEKEKQKEKRRRRSEASSVAGLISLMW